MLSDPRRAEDYARDGYVTVQLLDSDGVAAVRAIREQHGTAPGDPGTGLFNDTWSIDRTYKRTVSRALLDAMGDAVADTLVEHRILGLVHIVKWPGDGGRVPAHRDPSFVDEAAHRSAAVWCALEDLGPDDGVLRVVPGSHLLGSGVRVHQAPENLYPDVDEHADELSVAVPLRAGEAIVYDHRLIHLSDPIGGVRERTVVAGVMTPAVAAPVYSLSTPLGDVTVGIDEEFFLEHRLDSLDADEVLRTLPRAEPAPAAFAPLDLKTLRAARRRHRRRLRRDH
ncbi:MAG: phytanoyl-CoA dioxygenase family protein [Microthrixaceae bacterium]